MIYLEGEKDMDEKTKELIQNVCEEWIEAKSILQKLNPKFEGLELMEATKTVVEQTNKFKISAQINASRKTGNITTNVSKSVGREYSPYGSVMATDKQKKYLSWKKIPYTDSLTSKQASELISRDKEKGQGTDIGSKKDAEFF